MNLKYFKLTFLLVFCIGYTFMAQAQKLIKQGTITYSVDYQLPPDQQSIASMLPKEFKVTFKGDYSSFKMDMGMYVTSIIANSVTDEMLTLTDVPMQGKKISVKMNKAQAGKMREMQAGKQDFEVTTTTESKKLLGTTAKNIF